MSNVTLPTCHWRWGCADSSGDETADRQDVTCTACLSAAREADWRATKVLERVAGRAAVAVLSARHGGTPQAVLDWAVRERAVDVLLARHRLEFEEAVHHEQTLEALAGSGASAALGGTAADRYELSALLQRGVRPMAAL